MPEKEYRAAMQKTPENMDAGTPADRNAAAERDTPADWTDIPANWTDVPDWQEDGDDDAPPADMRAAARALQNALQGAGLPQNDTPLPALVSRVHRTQQLLRAAWGFACAAVAVVGLVMLIVFLHGYFSNVTLRVETPQLVQPDIRPPSSAGIRMVGEYIEVSLLEGSMPLDYDSATAVRSVDGADVPVECDAAAGAMRIPYQHMTTAYQLNVSDTGGNTFTFVIHVTQKEEAD